MVMTTDFVVDYLRPNGVRETKAFQVKRDENDIKTRQAKEKLILEKAWWGMRGIKWFLLFASEYNPVFCDNLQMIFRERNTQYPEPMLNLFADIFIAFTNLHKPYTLQEKICNKELPPLPGGLRMTFTQVVKALAGHKRAVFDIQNIPLLDCPLSDLVLVRK